MRRSRMRQKKKSLMHKWGDYLLITKEKEYNLSLEY
jgi:hypothetical protein